MAKIPALQSHSALLIFHILWIIEKVHLVYLWIFTQCHIDLGPFHHTYSLNTVFMPWHPSSASIFNEFSQSGLAGIFSPPLFPGSLPVFCQVPWLLGFHLSNTEAKQSSRLIPHTHSHSTGTRQRQLRAPFTHSLHSGNSLISTQEYFSGN